MSFSLPDEINHNSAHRVKEALFFSGYHELRKVEVLSEKAEVVLGGIVSTYYMKQMAQTIALSIDGVQQIQNSISVSETKGVEHDATRRLGHHRFSSAHQQWPEKRPHRPR